TGRTTRPVTTEHRGEAAAAQPDGPSSEAERAAASLLDLWQRWENPGRSANRGLNLQRIAAAAIEIADADGLAAVSMARLAERLGYTTMALYRHVSGKDELLELMPEAVFGSIRLDIPEGTAWRPGIEQWSREVLRPYVASPWLTEINPTGLNSPSQLAAMDQGLRLLDGTGLPLPEQAAILLAVSGHIASHARLLANISRTASGEGAPMGTLMAHIVGSGRLPWVEAAINGGIFVPNEDDPDDFEFGLALILDGVEALIARSAPDS
ncbi:MAG TPA: TetR/AcrR family transcriptional regulator, partial [Acidimicrobiales bacterium]|nr:TetR/AcrR family transcriptional regulator [Acidimicrobiales bacterium]